MEISTEIGSFLRLGGYEKVLTELKLNGFTAYDFSMSWEGASSELILSNDYEQKAIDLRKFADKIGIKCNQSHAPLTRERLGEYEYGEFGEELLRRAIVISGILGAKVCVVHQQKYFTAEQNAQFFKQFEPLQKKWNVKIGLENLWNWDSEKGMAKSVACSRHDDFRKHLDLLDKNLFVGCVDIGHAQMRGLETSAVQIIDALGDRLGAMHLDDTDNRFDMHWLPFSMHINFEEIIVALRRVKYSGDITFEVDKYTQKFPVELLPSVMRQMSAIGEYFRNRILE